MLSRKEKQFILSEWKKKYHLDIFPKGCTLSFCPSQMEVISVIVQQAAAIELIEDLLILV